MDSNEFKNWVDINEYMGKKKTHKYTQHMYNTLMFMCEIQIGDPIRPQNAFSLCIMSNVICSSADETLAHTQKKNKKTHSK